MTNSYHGFIVGQRVRNKVTDEEGTVIDPRHAYHLMNDKTPGRRESVMPVERARLIPQTRCIAPCCGSKADWRRLKLQIRCHTTSRDVVAARKQYAIGL